MKLAAILLAGISLLPQDPIFRAEANVAVIDVTATDKSGHLVRSLRADDFLVTLNKRQRRILSVEFVDAKPATRSQPAASSGPDLIVPGPTTNQPTERGRVFVFAIAAGMIGRGDGRKQMQQISDFLDHLATQDIVGLVSLPTLTPRVELTRDRGPIRAALQSIVGSGDRYRSCGPTFGEAAERILGDAKAARNAMLDRLVGKECLGDGQLYMSLAEHRIATRALLDSLGALSDALAGKPGPKTIVLAAEGFLADPELRDAIDRLAQRTEAAGTRVYALHLDAPILDVATRGNTTSTHNFDDHYGFDAMADVAMATGGAAFRIIGTATSRLDQIDEESSGYYVLGVEVDPAERGNKAMSLSVTSRRPGVDVRARRSVSIQPLAPRMAPSTADEASIAAAQLLQSPISISELPMSVDTAASPSAGPLTRHLLITDVAAPPDKIAAIGFHLATLGGRTIAYKIESPVALTAVDAGASYLVALDLPEGGYRLRVSAVAANGTRGSVERLFSVKTGSDATGPSDIVFGVDNTSPWQAVTGPAPGQKRLGVRVELPAAGSSRPTIVKLMVGRTSAAGWIEQKDLAVTGDGDTRSAAGAINTGQLTPGRYIARIELWRDGALTASTSKSFDVR